MAESEEIINLINELMIEHENIEDYTARILNIYVRDASKMNLDIEDLKRNIIGLRELLMVHTDFEEDKIYDLLDEDVSNSLKLEHSTIFKLFDDTIKNIGEINIVRRLRIISKMIREHIDREEREFLRRFIEI